MIHNKRILIVALGSGGDIISSCNLKWSLENENNFTVLSFLDFYNIAGKLHKQDITKINNLKKVNIVKNRYFAPFVANILDEDVFAIDASCLDKYLVDELENFCEKNKIDLIIGVDGGGDVFANYKTKILNVVPDAFGLRILSNLKIPSLIAVLAPTADRELTSEDWESILSESYKNGFKGLMDLRTDKFGIYSKIQEESCKVGKSYVNNVVKLSAEGYFGKYKTPYGFEINISPYQRFIYLFELDFVISKNEFVADLSYSTYEENLNNLAVYLHSSNIISGSLEEIKRRIDD